MTPANPDNYQQPSTSTSGDLFTKNETDEGDSDEGESSLEYVQKVCSEAIGGEASRNATNSGRKSIFKAADSTVLLTDSETDSLPSLSNQDDPITISDDSDLEAKMLSFDTEDQE